MARSGNTSAVTAKEASVTGVPDGAFEAMERAYDLGRIDGAERLPGGVSSDVFAVRTGARRLVLRVQQVRRGIESVAWEHALVAALGDVVPEVPAPLRTREGGTFVARNGVALWLLPYVDGAPARVDDRVERLEAARVLGRLHRAGADLALSPRPEHEPLADVPFPEVGSFPPELERATPRLRELRAEAIELVREAAQRRPVSGVVHGDFFPGNLLTKERRAVAVLDWEEANVDWQAYELACAAWNFTVAETDDELDRDAFAEFVDAYRAAGGTVPRSEDRLLLPFVRVKRVLEILRAPTDRRVDWDYQLRNLRAAEKLV